jgi:putative membrane protein insertion efficiency factor
MCKRVAILLLRLYKRTLSATLRRWVRCRFYPTCSEYGILAIQKYGLAKGVGKTWHRLLRCRPDNHESCIDYP